jgi:hypothetical protein
MEYWVSVWHRITTKLYGLTIIPHLRAETSIVKSDML